MLSMKKKIEQLLSLPGLGNKPPDLFFIYSPSPFSAGNNFPILKKLVSPARATLNTKEY
jgi:hypothetical protein